VPCHSQLAAEIIFSAAVKFRDKVFLSSVGLTMEGAVHEMYTLIFRGLVPRQAAGLKGFS
jgi:hypothetical protein